MNTRSLPRMSGQSALDIDARRIRDRAVRKASAGSKIVASATSTRSPIGQVAWFADMLTPDKNSFGVLRLAMALLVLVSHAVFLTTGKVSMEPLYAWTGYTLGQHGVQVFFILSGVLVAQSLFLSRSVADYTLARALRIFPALAVCVLLTAMALGPLLSELPAAIYLRDQWTASYIVKTLSLWTGSAELPGLFQNNIVPRAVNTSVWTLKYEALCYGLFALVGLVLLHMKAWRQAAMIAAFAWLMFALAVPSGISAAQGPRSMLHVLHYFTIFFGTGVLAYAARQWIPVHAAVLLPLGALFWMAIDTRFAVPAMALFLGYASIWLATFRFGPLRAFTNGNDYSYAAYLYHYPVAQAILHFAPNMHVVPLIGLTAGIVLPLAFLSWEMVERPALALRKRLHRRVEAQTIDTATLGTATLVTDRATVAAPSAPSESIQRAAVDVASPQPALPADLNAPLARVWRPMPTRRTISVMPESSTAQAASQRFPVTPTVSAAEQEPPAAAIVAPPSEAKSLPKPVQRTFSARKAASPAEAEPATPPAVIPQSRMALATNRSRPSSPPLPSVEPQAPIEPSRAVVVVTDEDTQSWRVAPPRPNWQRPNPQPT